MSSSADRPSGGQPPNPKPTSTPNSNFSPAASTSISLSTSTSTQLKSLRTDSEFGITSDSSALEQERIQRQIEDRLISNLSHSNVFTLYDLLPLLTHGMEVIVQDDFSRCFQSAPHQPWNWNAYLYILWGCGCIIRYCILLPLRVISLIIGWTLFGIALFGVKLLIKNPIKRAHYERKFIRFICGVFVFSWTGVIKYHGTIPSQKPNRIYVANHTSMIDMIILSQMHSFSIVGQKHPGWVGFMQDYVLGSLDNCWFNRSEASDRTAVAKKIQQHISNPSSNRLLVFPEGTCVNNEYCVQFKQGVFDMGAEICPIAIKYNKIFVDAFWNSREQSFFMHLCTLMCSWAVVCDVYYLEPQTIRPGETAIQFSNRVKQIIAERAGLKNVAWDGYLKHFRPSARYMEEQQKLFADSLLRKLTIAEQKEAQKQEQIQQQHHQHHQHPQPAATSHQHLPQSAPQSVGPSVSASASGPVVEEHSSPRTSKQTKQENGNSTENNETTDTLDSSEAQTTGKVRERRKTKAN